MVEVEERSNGHLKYYQICPFVIEPSVGQVEKMLKIEFLVEM